jgi:hypothetical protein
VNLIINHQNFSSVLTYTEYIQLSFSIEALVLKEDEAVIYYFKNLQANTSNKKRYTTGFKLSTMSM